MTTLTSPRPSPNPQVDHPTMPPHRHARVHRPARLQRSAPGNTWDPLAVDAEASTLPERELSQAQDIDATPLEDLSKVASILTKAIAEVLLGTRSITQIQSWLLEDVWHVIRRRASLTHRAADARRQPSAVRILRVHPCQVDERTCELSVVLHDGQRVRAAALRLTLHRRRWRAAAVRIG